MMGAEMSEILTDDDDDRPIPLRASTLDDEAIDKRNKLLIEIWKQAVETQKHFNDMCVKSRQLGLTFVAASLGAAFYLFIRSTPVGGEPEVASLAHSISAYSLSVCGHTFVLHVSLAIIGAAAAAVFAVRHLDLGVYHQMLRGAVTFGEDLEEKHIKAIVGLRKGMTQTISHFSRYSDADKKVASDGRYEYFGEKQVNAGKKLKRFYNIIFVLLAVFAILVLWATNFLKAVG
jgi:hypothetical protein